MKPEVWGNALVAALLGCLLALGAGGCLITAFSLPLAQKEVVAFAWGFAAVFSACLLCIPRGGSLLACLLALGTGYVWHRGSPGAQFWSLVYRISHIYNQAYGCGVIQRTRDAWDQGVADWPLGIGGCVLAILVVWTVCRRKTVLPAVLAAVLAVLPCIVVTDTVPDTIWLFCLFLGLSLLVLTGSVRRESAAQGNRLTAMALLPAAAAGILLFLCVPRDSYVNQAKPLQQRIAHTLRNLPSYVDSGLERLSLQLQGGVMQQIDLSGVGPLAPFHYPVMEVTAEEGGILYLRGQDFDSYTGTGWASSTNRQEVFAPATEDAGAVTIHTRNAKSLYYTPYYPGQAVNLASGKQENEARESSYTFRRTALPPNWRETMVRSAASTPAEEMAPYLQLPAATRQGAESILQDLSLSGRSNGELADLLAALVCGSAVYDLDTPQMPPDRTDFALWFLQESETGYCVHFASAAVVLLRAAGIPARYVTGYLATVPAGETVTVTEDCAHAWAEYYEPSLGLWIPLEATPAAQEEIILLPGPETEVTPPAQTDAPAPAESLPLAPTREPGPAGESLELPSVSPALLTAIARILVTAAAAIVIFTIQRSTRIRLRRLRQRSGAPNSQALERWKQTQQLSRLLKESPGEELLCLAQKARFSQHDLTAEELQKFDSYNRSCLRQLREHPWHRKLLYQYIYAIY